MPTKKALPPDPALLVGRTIKAAEIMADNMLALTLDNGAVAFVQSDPEGNGPGTIYYLTTENTYTLIGGR